MHFTKGLFIKKIFLKRLEDDCCSYSSDDILSVVPLLSHFTFKEKQQKDLSIRELINQAESGESVPSTTQLPLLW